MANFPYSGTPEQKRAYLEDGDDDSSTPVDDGAEGAGTKLVTESPGWGGLFGDEGVLIARGGRRKRRLSPTVGENSEPRHRPQGTRIFWTTW
jgi:hypothetical protein